MSQPPESVQAGKTTDASVVKAGAFYEKERPYQHNYDSNSCRHSGLAAGGAYLLLCRIL